MMGHIFVLYSARIWHNTRLGSAGPRGQVARVSWVQTGGGRHNTPACIAM